MEAQLAGRLAAAACGRRQSGPAAPAPSLPLPPAFFAVFHRAAVLPAPLRSSLHPHLAVSLKPDLFEGLRFDLTKPLNHNFALSHSIFMGNIDVPTANNQARREGGDGAGRTGGAAISKQGGGQGRRAGRGRGPRPQRIKWRGPLCRSAGEQRDGGSLRWVPAGRAGGAACQGAHKRRPGAAVHSCRTLMPYAHAAHSPPGLAACCPLPAACRPSRCPSAPMNLAPT